MNRSAPPKKVVVVTGAASGIGAAICRRFARSGFAVGLIDMDPDALETFKWELASEGADCLSVVCDVSDPAACRTAIGQMIEHFGGIDLLVNNAGITQRGTFAENRIEVYRRVMDVNFFGSVYCTKAALDTLIRRKGMIVVMESIAGVTPLLGRTGYCASKHALHGFFTTLRCELRHKGVHVLIVCPGFVRTDLQSRALGSDGRIAGHPQTRVGRQETPKTVAEAVYRGVLNRRHLLLFTPMGILGYWISRLAPALYERLMTRQFRSELR